MSTKTYAQVYQHLTNDYLNQHFGGDMLPRVRHLEIVSYIYRKDADKIASDVKKLADHCIKSGCTSTSEYWKKVGLT